MTIPVISFTIAPVAAIVWFVYSRDRYEKEPTGLLVRAFFLGLLSIIPAAIGSMMGGEHFRVFGGTFNIFIYAFGIVAFSEEFAKFLFLRFIVFKYAEFDEPYDGIIYSVMIGMGFATFENFLYVADGGMRTALLRMFTAVPAHAVFGVAMGYYVGMAKFDPGNELKYLFMGLAAAVLLHGAYDFFLMQRHIPELFVVSFIGLIFAIRWSVKALKLHADLSPHKDDLPPI